MAKEKRLIDGNELYRKLSGLNMTLTGIRSGKSMLNVFLKEYLKGVLDTVEAQPTVDAVEVVRCKDCENRVYVDNGDEIGEIGGCKLFKMAMPYDSFCSYGKRRLTENV